MFLFLKFVHSSASSTLRLRYRVSIHRRIHNESEIRVRFAPSPTGFLHLGGLRTALYNFLFAKSHNGKFILRIEDTDQTRLVGAAVKKLEYDLEWAGLQPDESPSIGGCYGPYLQSQRLSLYIKEAKRLLKNGTAYYCFCNDRRLHLLKKDAIRRREIPKYDNRCRLLTGEEIEEKLRNGASHCIRFKLTPFFEPVEDLVYGKVVHNVAAVEGDPIIVKSDGFPTYHFANVVDDHYMRISHVLRGVEWQQSTVKHLLLYRALSWNPPKFAHLPLLMNVDGTKLSKRNQNVTVEAYRNDGIYPLALINFITTSGGGFSRDSKEDEGCKIKSLEHLTEKFEINLVNPHNCQLQYGRLDEYNRAAIQDKLSDEVSFEELAREAIKIIETHFSRKNIEISLDETRVKHVLKWSSNRISRLKDLVGSDFTYLWVLPSTGSLSQQEKKNFEVLRPLISDLKRMDDLNAIFLSNYFKHFVKEYNIEYASLMKFLRLCLSGSVKGPSVVEMVIHLGRNAVLQRLQRAEFLYQNEIK